MIREDRDALVCDFAETYHIYDMRALPVSTLATLAVGLRADSRIKMRLSETSITRSELLLAAAVDRLSLLWWAKTENGRNNVARPKSILSVLLGTPEQERNVEAFDSADDYESEWARRTGAHHGQI